MDGLQGGASWMMAFTDKPAVKALVAYLTSDEGGRKWAEVTYSQHGEERTVFLIKKAALLDLGDSIPG
jgi:alpha-glucoside transport system substrate-binding protein